MSTGNVEGWDEFLRVVGREFPDSLGGDDSEFRALVIRTGMAGGDIVGLGDRFDSTPDEIMALKRCVAAAREARGGCPPCPAGP